jgi:SAM-dependent methyltransferase
MNYKLLFPTYRNRYLFVRENLKAFEGKTPLKRVLNLGTGEGDYDPMIAGRVGEMVSCDINEADIAFAKQLNQSLSNVHYQVDNALDLSFQEASFDLIISVDVMEHVGNPEKMTEEIGRVLRPGGMAFITFPQYYFPWTYDPINKLLRFLTGRKIAQGAYAFGHEYLIKREDFKKWAERYGLEVVDEQNLSGHLVALLEVYWTGWIQKIFKNNAGNVNDDRAKKIALRPSVKEPGLVKFTDALIRLDKILFGSSKYSVGKGFVVRKKER